MNIFSNKRPRLLIVGCGDIGERLIASIPKHWRVFAVTTKRERIARLRSLGVTPIIANLDMPKSVKRLVRIASLVVHCVPPNPNDHETCKRTRLLCALLERNACMGRRTRLIYLSTTGVYGNRHGIVLDETASPQPFSKRAKRRLAAEHILRAQKIMETAVLRVPGIYDGDQRSPRARIENKAALLNQSDDVYTNHIHADDLARIVWIALFRARNNRVYNAVDFTRLRMGDYFDYAAKLYQLPYLERISRDELKKKLTPEHYTFYSESRLLDNQRLINELGVHLLYPTIEQGLIASNSPKAAHIPNMKFM